MASTKIKIGHYTLLQTIGVGSFGKVKLAVHSLTGHKVAMKIVNRRRIASLDMGNRVRREIQYLKLLRHPHVIKLYEVITTPTDVIMVLEYVGSEMFNYIVERGKMSEDDARQFFQQIICAVEYCHRHKIVHRDLKPENLLLDSYNNVKIADFGLSNIMTDGDFLKTSCGSPNYAAPEVISGRLYAGPEVDVWSCGVILYVMLCGRLPFDDEFIPNLFKKINSGVYSVPPFVSLGAKELLSLMLVVDPLKRATIAEIRENAWFNINLPAYLQPLPEWEDDPLDTFDEGIILELVKKLNFDRETVLTALTEPENNQIKVSYQLVIDQKRMLNHTKSSKFKGIHNFLYATSPPPWNAAMRTSSSTRTRLRGIERNESASEDHRKLRRSSITVLSSSLAKSGGSIDDLREAGHRHRVTTESGQPTSTSPAPPVPSISVSKLKARSKWHVGIRSKSPPLEVMLEVYRALRNLEIAWKTVNPYRLRCRFIYPEGNVVKLDLQLYTLNSNSNYLLDFKHIPLSLGKTSPVTVHSPPTSTEADPLPRHTPPAESMLAKSASKMIGDSRGRKTVPDSTGGGVGDEEDLTVTSIFPFFDICTKLIAELVTM